MVKLAVIMYISTGLVLVFAAMPAVVAAKITVPEKMIMVVAILFLWPVVVFVGR